MLQVRATTFFEERIESLLLLVYCYLPTKLKKKDTLGKMN